MNTLMPWQISLLRRCPMTLSTVKGQRLSRDEKFQMEQLKILWSGRFVRGEVTECQLHFTLTDRGRQTLSENPEPRVNRR